MTDKEHFKIVKKGTAFYVMVLYKVTLFGRKYKPYITWAGMDTAYPFTSFESALNQMILNLKHSMINENNKA